MLGQSQPRVSRHLKILADAGVLERRKEGSWVFLTLADAGAGRADVRADRRLGRWGDPRLFAADAARTETIRAERAEAANRYFAAMPKCGTRSARSMSPKAKSSARSTARSANDRSAGWSISAPAPAG